MTNAFNVPQLRLHLDHQVRRMKVQVVSASGRNFHLAFDMELLARSSGSASFFAFPFNGETTSGDGKRTFVVPDGTYVFKLSLAKAGGDPRNAADWENLTTNPFTIDRP